MSADPATYLLRADPEDMRRWKTAAGELGLSFKDFVAEALEEKMSRGSQRAPVKSPVRVHHVPGKKTYDQDPK